jgi:hypothetical protein
MSDRLAVKRLRRSPCGKPSAFHAGFTLPSAQPPENRKAAAGKAEPFRKECGEAAAESDARDHSGRIMV